MFNILCQETRMEQKLEKKLETFSTLFPIKFFIKINKQPNVNITLLRNNRGHRYSGE